MNFMQLSSNIYRILRNCIRGIIPKFSSSLQILNCNERRGYVIRYCKLCSSQGQSLVLYRINLFVTHLIQWHDMKYVFYG
jgi:hypothetical protein